MRRYLKFFGLVFLTIFCFVGMFLFESIDVLMAFFPLENLDAVVFTLTHNVDGTTNLMWLLLEPCLKTAAENTFWGLAFIVSIIVFFLHISCKKKSIDFLEQNLSR